MRTHLARLVGFSAGYLAVVLLDRVVRAAEADRVRRIDVGGPEDHLEPADVSEVLTSHGCLACCGVAA
jgi:hypothetical protein